MYCRNEEYQEDLWRRSLEFLKEHLSPETVEKYGPRPPGTDPPEPAAGTDSGEPDQHQQRTKAEATDAETEAAANITGSDEKRKTDLDT